MTNPINISSEQYRVYTYGDGSNSGSNPMPANPAPPIGEDALRERARDRVIMASVRLGSWLSAALDDPAVCDSMKADIREWFSAGEPVAGWNAESELAAVSGDLLPCPFCGHRDNDIVDHRWMCNCCGAEGPPSRTDPDAAWNKRAALSEAQAQLERARVEALEEAAQQADAISSEYMAAWAHSDNEASKDRNAARVRAVESVASAIRALARDLVAGVAEEG